jgi:hypothetical protein
MNAAHASGDRCMFGDHAETESEMDIQYTFKSLSDLAEYFEIKAEDIREELDADHRRKLETGVGMMHREYRGERRGEATGYEVAASVIRHTIIEKDMGIYGDSAREQAEGMAYEALIIERDGRWFINIENDPTGYDTKDEAESVLFNILNVK